MKILLDFDGTLTNIQHEQDFEIDYLKKSIEEKCHISADEFMALYQSARDAVALDQASYGWFDNGRISAYSDEDLFMQVASVMTLLDQWLATGHKNVADIAARMSDSGTTFMELTEETHAVIHEQPLCAFNTPEPEVVSTIRTLLDRDSEIVVASNSPASRIISKFEHVGLKPVDNEDNPSAQFRIWGNAKKFRLGDNPIEIQFGKRIVDVDRPAFAEIIRKERPQVIVGDVFSLDLALPIEMARREPMIYEDMQLYLRMRNYTPQWAIDCALNPPQDAPVTVRLLNHFGDLASLIHKH